MSFTYLTVVRRKKRYKTLTSIGIEKNSKQELHWKGKKKNRKKGNTADKSSFRCLYDKFLWVNLFSICIQHISISLWSFLPLGQSFRKENLQLTWHCKSTIILKKEKENLHTVIYYCCCIFYYVTRHYDKTYIHYLI